MVTKPIEDVMKENEKAILRTDQMGNPVIENDRVAFQPMIRNLKQLLGQEISIPRWQQEIEQVLIKTKF